MDTNVRSTSKDGAFEQFWASYPRRVGKFAAAKALARALKHASLEEILAGVDRYKRTKPAYADWAHPSSWLNAGRWLDEPDQSVSAAPPLWFASRECPHTPKCQSRSQCDAQEAHV